MFNYLFQHLVSKKDIRIFNGNYFYYILFRFFRYFISGEFKISIFNFYVYASASNKQTSHSLIKKCNFSDTHELATINKFNKHKNIVFFDCGSNFGFYSLYVASLSKKNKIFAFEASKKTKLQFDKNIAINNFNNIISNNKAISDKENKELIFNVSDHDWESSLTHSNFLSFKSENVLSATIDQEMKLHRLISDYLLIIKIDIEGHEFNAIRGSERTIRTYSPLIIIEFSTYNLHNKQYNFSYFKKFLEDFDYKIYNVKLENVSVKDILNLLDKLQSHKTIGNYYLVKDNSLQKSILLSG
jgi:FkbM family methyltransferase